MSQSSLSDVLPFGDSIQFSHFNGSRDAVYLQLVSHLLTKGRISCAANIRTCSLEFRAPGHLTSLQNTS